MYSPKSASVAGILGILLGAFGAHDWYLGNRQKQGRRHVFLTIGGIAFFFIVIALHTIASSGQIPNQVVLVNNIATILYVIAWLITIGNIIWGAIEGVLILAQGDSGLKSRGYFINNDPDNPLSHSLSTASVRDGVKAPSPQPINNHTAVPHTAVSLPSAPTLEQQGSNVRREPQPIVFRSSDIHQAFQFNNIFDDMANSTPDQTTSPQPPSAQPQPQPQPQPAPLQVQSQSLPTASNATVNPTSPQLPAVTPPQPSNPVNPQPAAAARVMNRPVIKQAFGTKTVKDVIPKAPHKFTFSPAIIRRIIISIAVVAFVVIAGFVVKAILSSTIASNYGATYRAAKALSPKISAAARSADCQHVSDDLGNINVSQNKYTEYVTSCRSTLTEIGPLIVQLGETPAISGDSTLSASYQQLKETYDSAFPDTEQATLMSTYLDAYQAWHTYLISLSLLTPDSTDEDFDKAASILRESGDEALAKYGEDWLNQELKYIYAYRRYEEADQSSPDKSRLRYEMEQEHAVLTKWEGEHMPDLITTLPIAAPDIQSLSRNFTSLYELIKRAYINNYDHNSGDCDDRSGTIYCD